MAPTFVELESLLPPLFCPVPPDADGLAEDVVDVVDWEDDVLGLGKLGVVEEGPTLLCVETGPTASW